MFVGIEHGDGVAVVVESDGAGHGDAQRFAAGDAPVDGLAAFGVGDAPAGERDVGVAGVEQGDGFVAVFWAFDRVDQRADDAHAAGVARA